MKSSEDVTLFDEFDLKGQWWLPDNSSSRLVGQLSFRPDSGINLLVGNFGGQDSLITVLNQVTHFEPIICGFTTDGKNVALLDSFATISGSFPGIPEQHFRSDLLLLGDAVFTSPQEVRFASLGLNPCQIEAWIDHVPFEVDISGRVMHYRPPPAVTAAVSSIESEVSLLARYNYAPRARREFKWSYRYYVQITPWHPQSWDWFLDSIVGISDLLTLFMWQPIHPRRVVGLGEEPQIGQIDGPSGVRRAVTEVFWSNRMPPAEPELSESRILFRLGDIEPKFDAVIDSWFSTRKQLGPVCELFFGSFYATHIHIPFQFLAMTRALEGFHRVIHGRQYHSDNDYEEHKSRLEQLVKDLSADNDWKNKFISGELRYSNQYSQRKRLKELLKLLDPTLRELLMSDVEAFVSRIVATRIYLTHLDTEAQRNALQGRDLRFGFHKLQILMGVLLLRQVGFTDTELVRALRGNSAITHILVQSGHI